MMKSSNESDEVSSAQHIKDFKVAIEYKYLMKNAPGGVYVLPEFDDIRQLHGVIFIRRGCYRDGIFRFTISLPPGYNDVDLHPRITFTPPIFSPLIDQSSGEFDLKCDPVFKTWNPEKHYLVNVLVNIKKIFYMKSYEDLEFVVHKEAKDLFDANKDEYYKRARSCVDESLTRMNEKPSENNPIVFTEHKLAHEEVLKKIFAENDENSSAGTNENNWVASASASSSISTA